MEGPMAFRDLRMWDTQGKLFGAGGGARGEGKRAATTEAESHVADDDAPQWFVRVMYQYQ